MQELSTTQTTALNQAARSFSSVYSGGLGQLIQDIIVEFSAGSVGIRANAWDVDSLAADGGAFSRDETNTTGLTFAYFAGRVYNGSSIVSVAAGTVTLSPSTTNYVEVDSAGTVSVNTSGFTATSMPLYQIATGSSAITTVINKKTFLVNLASLTGARLTTTAKTKTIEIPLGAIAATSSFLFVAPHACTITGISLANTAAIAGNDTDYWTASAVNKGPSGSGTTALLAATDPNTTKATGGTSISAYINRDFTLHATSANLDLAAGDVCVFTLTKTASATALAGAVLRVNYKSEL